MSLFSVIFTTIYIWVRPIIKWILRRTTRLCELQRICYGEEKGAQRTLQIEYSIEHSRSLEMIKMLHLLNNKAKNKVITQDIIYYAVFAVIKIKKINIKVHRKFPEMLSDCLLRIWGYRQMKSSLEFLRSTKYDSSSLLHEEKLMQLWSKLMPQENLTNRISKQWQEIGFQGDDPATDFRGMGMLGLENLLYFANEHSNAAQHVLLRSQHPVYGYSFAIVSINLTMTAFKFVENGAARSHFYNAVRKGLMPITAFNQFYCYLFFEFDVLWRQEKPKDIMQFNRVKEKFDQIVCAKLNNPVTCFRCNFVLENI